MELHAEHVVAAHRRDKPSAILERGCDQCWVRRRNGIGMGEVHLRVTAFAETAAIAACSYFYFG